VQNNTATRPAQQQAASGGSSSSGSSTQSADAFFSNTILHTCWMAQHAMEQGFCYSSLKHI
jgi:hypothetical protein